MIGGDGLWSLGVLSLAEAGGGEERSVRCSCSFHSIAAKVNIFFEIRLAFDMYSLKAGILRGWDWVLTAIGYRWNRKE